MHFLRVFLLFGEFQPAARRRSCTGRRSRRPGGPRAQGGGKEGWRPVKGQRIAITVITFSALLKDRKKQMWKCLPKNASLKETRFKYLVRCLHPLVLRHPVQPHVRRDWDVARGRRHRLLLLLHWVSSSSGGGGGGDCCCSSGGGLWGGAGGGRALLGLLGLAVAAPKAEAADLQET